MMMMKALLVLALGGVVATGCGQGAEHECATYARRDFECGGYPAAEKEITLKLAEGFCRELKAGNKDLEMLTGVKAGLACTKTTRTCAEYQACVDRTLEAGSAAGSAGSAGAAGSAGSASGATP